MMHLMRFSRVPRRMIVLPQRLLVGRLEHA